jgi:alpha-galactosidase
MCSTAPTRDIVVSRLAALAPQPSRRAGALGRWIDLHKQVRPLIATGTLVHPDHADPAVMVTGIVAADRSEAWYVVATVASPATQHPAALRLTGLDPDRTYRIADVTATADQHGADLTTWWAAAGEHALPGRVLATAGVSLPVMAPETARVLRLTAGT